MEAAVSRRRRRWRGFDELERRAARAEVLVGLGELSSARQALEGADLAPGTENTKRLLTDRNKRPPELLDSIPVHVANNVPPFLVALDEGHHFSKLCQPVLVASAWPMHFRGICEVNPNHLVHGRGQCVRYSVLAMLDGLHTLVGSEALPFVHIFHGTPSSHAWESSFLPVWIFMWQFLPVYASLQEHLQSCAKISIQSGKTQVWNSAGVKRAASNVFERMEQVADQRCSSVAWVRRDRFASNSAGDHCVGHPHWVTRLCPGLSGEEGGKAEDFACKNPSCA